MARGRQRIRQRGSRQQWAEARNFKAFSGDGTGDEATPAADDLRRPLGSSEVVASTRCGLCGMVVEQRLQDGPTVTLVPYALCISCDQVRCESCWDVSDDFCDDDEEHEFLEVHYAENGQSATADFASWLG